MQMVFSSVWISICSDTENHDEGLRKFCKVPLPDVPTRSQEEAQPYLPILIL